MFTAIKSNAISFVTFILMAAAAAVYLTVGMAVTAGNSGGSPTVSYAAAVQTPTPSPTPCTGDDPTKPCPTPTPVETPMPSPTMAPQ